MLEDLRRIAATVGELRGWDFSRVESVRDPVPWDYTDVARRYLRSSDRVLDVGTGGGEVFLSLAPDFATGVGIDVNPSMIRVAQENTPAALRDRVCPSRPRDTGLTGLISLLLVPYGRMDSRARQAHKPLRGVPKPLNTDTLPCARCGGPPHRAVGTLETSAKTPLPNVERSVFPETRVTGFRLAA